MNMVTFAGIKKEPVDTLVPGAVIKLQMETNLIAEHRKRPGSLVEYELLLIINSKFCCHIQMTKMYT